VISLLQAGMSVVVLDNLCNSKKEVVDKIESITKKSICFIAGDIRDRALLQTIFKDHPIDAVIHFAGLKAVGESVAKPLEYFDNNVGGSLILFEEMAKANVKNLVFSSSATVYGDAKEMPISEDFPLQTLNPYGRSKLMVENILRDLFQSDPSWRIALLRYFNPVGAHESGLIGEDPSGVPNNLMPFVAQVVSGQQKELLVFGDDYETKDGTGVRDYIHVQDLAEGHLAALQYIEREPGLVAVNLGTGRGYSVFEMIEAFEKASGKKVSFRVVARRPGDIAVCYADPSLAKKLFAWEAKLNIDRMCVDAWRWQQQSAHAGR
jgi:UDP-glucose 4-epimerase